MLFTDLRKILCLVLEAHYVVEARYVLVARYVLGARYCFFLTLVKYLWKVLNSFGFSQSC